MKPVDSCEDLQNPHDTVWVDQIINPVTELAIFGLSYCHERSDQSILSSTIAYDNGAVSSALSESQEIGENFGSVVDFYTRSFWQKPQRRA